MKRSIVILFFSLLIIQCVKGQIKDKPYEFPVKPGTSEWKNFNTGKEMCDALLIPIDILNRMSTENLVETCLNYPLFGSILAYNDLQTGFDFVTKDFNGLQELLKRKDAGKALLEKYKHTNPEILGISWKDQSKTVYVFTYLELIIAQEPIISVLSEKEKTELIRESLRLLEEKQKFPNKYSLFVQKTSYLLMVRILKFEDVKIIDDNSTLENHDKLDQFINFCILPDLNTLYLIKEKAIEFLSPK